MKEVLIPVDFSEESVIALEYGIDLANHLQANVRVIHVKTDSVIVPFFTNDLATDTLSQDVEAWAQKLHDKFVKNYTVKCGYFDFKIREGNVVKEVCNQARYGDSTLIVLGAHEDSSISAKWVGSPAYRLVAHSPCPVIVVNKRMKMKHEISSIALPVDYSIASRKKVPEIAGMARLFGADVHVVGLKTADLTWMNKEMKNYVKQVKQFISNKAKVEVVEAVLTGREYAENLLTYVDENDIDLVTTHVHHTPNPFVRIFQSFTNDLINNSIKPVLVIPTKD
ncbi:universal stress protein [Carboxylicivirga sp. A043]|uniref:universal stress protein n=1 Tax=Carboxylicivirga litoralis TaxID=2816963 RepID=UPI0021CB828F|nr:universal stress protein [Carboxylicivirga sp. A043]MCU4156249.1 universal stress protein [Carboxylicivirga sp. A043]